MIKYSISVTATDGGEATVTGSQSAIDAVSAALLVAGAVFNEQVETYDFGFYTTPTKD